MRNALSKMYEAIYVRYGIEKLTLEEESSQPRLAKQTRYNKIEIIDTCRHMENLIETIQRRAKGAPELNDPHHAALVQEFADKVNEAYKAIEAACRVGY